jgi:tRNA(adenine34) deaminase
MTQNERWMEYAFREAEKAFDQNEVPVGCIIVRGNKIIGKGYNQNETLKDPTAHAEIIAITAAAAQLKSKIMEGCTMYVTLEPCPMCAGALVLARIQTLVFGAYDPKAGACGTLYTITEDVRLNHRVQTIGGVLDEKCSVLLREFFALKRSGGNGGGQILSRN